MKITKPIGTSYLCSQFINHDGTKCSDHPVYFFKTDNPDIYACVMFTTSSNHYTVKDRKGNPIYFRGCSTFSKEVESNRLFQAEIYLCPVDKIKDRTIALSDYTFKKNEEYTKNMLLCLKESIEQRLMNSNFGIKSIHFYDETHNIKNQLDILNSLYRLVISMLKDKEIKFPVGGIKNCDFKQFRKENNTYKNVFHNQKIFDKRENHHLRAVIV